MDKLPFFVFGTLRTGQSNWYHYLRGRTSREIPATLPGHAMYLVSYSAWEGQDPADPAVVAGHLTYTARYPTVVQTTDDSRVTGNLAYIKDQHYAAVLAELDHLEDYDPISNSGWYLRVIREVEYTDPATGQLQRVPAWVYCAGPTMQPELTDSNRVPSGDWFKP